MSYLANEWASEAAPVADVYERAILGKLATRASDDGTAAYPSVPSMARAALCDTETVRRKLRNMQKRGLIGPGDQRLVTHFRADRRPKVYDLLIPADWYSAQQRDKVNTQRGEEGKPALTEANRPPIAPPPRRTQRADTGKPNPKRSPKHRTRTNATPLAEGSPNRGENLNDPSLRGGDDPSQKPVTTPLREGQTRPVEPVRKKTRPSGSIGQTLAAHTADEAREGRDIPTPDKPRDDRRLTATRFVADVTDQARSAGSAPTRDQHDALVDLVVTAWDTGLGNSTIRHELSRDLATAKFVGKVWIKRLAELIDAAQRSQAHREQARSATRKQTRPSEPPAVIAVGSPVTWLTDTQFAGLSKLDQGHVRTAGETPVEELPPLAAKRITAIRAATKAAA